jgi:hypothetical protein
MPAPVIVPGTLKPDGTLELDQMPNLPPGPVLVSVQPVPSATASTPGLAGVIDDIRRRQQARGFQGRSAQDIEAQRQEGEASYEQRTQALRAPSNPGPLAGGS